MTPGAPNLAFATLEPRVLPFDVSARVDPFTGRAIVSVPIRISRGRSGFAPALALHHDPSGSNSPFGVGWDLDGVLSISVSTLDRLPRYDGTDRYVFGPAGEVVPCLRQAAAGWEPEVEDRGDFWVMRFRARHETRHLRLERWLEKATGRVHWRTRDADDVLTVYGLDPTGCSRIADPADPSRVFTWLADAQYDGLGNAIAFEYVAEDVVGVDRAAPFERDRAPSAQRYLRRIRYANTTPLAPGDDPESTDWHLHVVLDFGDHDAAAPAVAADRPWPVRADPFSTCRPGFDVRSRRLVRRVLTFHQFASLGPEPALVGELVLEHREDAAGSMLQRLRFIGHRPGEATGLDARAIPPMSFDYAGEAISTAFEVPAASTLENLPAGLKPSAYRFTDLYGDGLPGFLVETGPAWYYKRNHGDGTFGPQEVVLERPRYPLGQVAIADFDGDGNPNLAVLHGRGAGYYEYRRDEGRWRGYQPLDAIPHLEAAGARAQWLDLDGDGRQDLVVADLDRLHWFRSLGKAGFGAAEEVLRDDPAQPAGEDVMLGTFFADMNGDGLADQVRIESGRVEYWPQLGNGHFGPRVVMEGDPRFASGEDFDPRRLLFVDLDGSGTSDLLYVGANTIQVWRNASGNRLVPQPPIRELPTIDRQAALHVLDILGDGRPCLVWSSGTDPRAPMRVLPLTGPNRPRRLLSVANGAGARASLVYGTSAQHYLRDRRAGTPWRTRLPGHQTVVDELVIEDQLSGSRAVKRYAYHDGVFDREARVSGFGRVEELDTPSDDVMSAASCTRRWYVVAPATSGSDEWYRGDALAADVPAITIEDLATFGEGEYEAALHSVMGCHVRTEIFGIGADGAPAPHPIAVTQQGYRIRRLQPTRGDLPAAFFPFVAETLRTDYEGAPHDPHVIHELDLEVDPVGISTRACTVGYRRRPAAAAADPQQARTVVAVHDRRVARVDAADRFVLGMPVESRTWEIRGLEPGGVAFGYRELRDAVAPLIAVAIEHHMPFGAAPQARAAAWTRTRYWNDAGTAALPLGSVGSPALVHHTETACFASASVPATFGGLVDAPKLVDAGYVEGDGHWWSMDWTRVHARRQAFHRLERMERMDGAVAAFAYDATSMSCVEIVDAAGNHTRADIDDVALAPWRIVDPNGAAASVRYDALCVPVVTSLEAEVLDAADVERPFGFEALVGYVPVAGATTADVLAQPDAHLQQAATFTHYELAPAAARPPNVVRLVRETFRLDGTGAPPADGRTQVQVDYLDGFGRVRQAKRRVEPGDAVLRDAAGALVLAAGEPVTGPVAERWLADGHVAYDGRQQVVRKFQPYFTSTAAYEPEPELAAFGGAVSFVYDAAGRRVETGNVDGTRTRVEHGSWGRRVFDENDAVDGSLYALLRDGLAADHPEHRALTASVAHAGTPGVIDIDPLGREVVQRETSSSGDRVTRIERDVRGEPLSIVDPRGIAAVAYTRDLHGRVLRMRSADAGESRSLPDAFDRPIEVWDGNGTHQTRTFDRLDRPVSLRVSGTLGLDQVVEEMVYGEDPSIAQPELRHARGRLALHRDQAGTVEYRRYNPTGKILGSVRRVREAVDVEVDWGSPAAVALLPAVFTSASEFDTLGRPVRQALPDGSVRRTSYLASGPPERVTLDTTDGKVTGLDVFRAAVHDAFGDRSAVTLGNGVRLERDHDPGTERVTAIRAIRPARSAVESPTTLQALRYGYDAAGNVIASVDDAQQPATPRPILQGLSVSPEMRFTYDDFGQLVTATGRVHQALLPVDDAPNAPGTVKGTRHLSFNNGAAVERYTRSFEYDLGGNLRLLRHHGASRDWTLNLWVSPSSNRSLPALDPSGNPVANPDTRFDANGNLRGLDHLRSLVWNYRNGIAAAVIVDRSAAGQPDDAERYIYDGGGTRVRKVTQRLVAGGLEVTDRIYVDGGELKTITLAGAPVLEAVVSHLSDGSGRVALVHRWTLDGAARETDDTTQARVRYPLSNHLGTSQLELDERGDVVSYEEYFPFGGTSFIAGDAMREVERKTYRFCGRERDDATGLYSIGHRYYAPWIGRWLSPDPIGPEEDLNLYRYCRNDPIGTADPTGLDPIPRPPGQRFVNERSDYPAEFGFQNLAPDVQAGVRRGSLVIVIMGENQPVVITRQLYERLVAERTARGENVAENRVGPRRRRPPPSNRRQTPPAARPTVSSENGDPTAEGGRGSTPVGSGPVAGPESGTDGRGGQARGPNGDPAASRGRSESGDEASGNTNNADGGLTPATPPGQRPAPGNGLASAGEGNAGTAPAPGGQVVGREGTGPGGMGTADVPAPGRTMGSGLGAEQGTGHGNGPGDRHGSGTGDGPGVGEDPDGVEGAGPDGDRAGTGGGQRTSGEPGGVQGGSTGVGANGVASGTATTGLPGGVAGGAPGGVDGGVVGGSLGGAPVGIANGAATGAPASGGVTAPIGQTHNGDDPSGTPTGRPDGVRNGGRSDPGGNPTAGNATGQGNPRGSADGRPGGRPEGRPGGDGGRGHHRKTLLDRYNQLVAYGNLMFDEGDPSTASAEGIPGGRGSHDMGGWGKWLFAIVGTLGVVSMFLGGAEIKAFFKGLGSAVARVFTRAFWRNVGAKIAGWYARHSIEVAVGEGAIRFFPIHVAWKAGGQWLHAAGSKPLLYLSRLGSTWTRWRTGNLTLNRIFQLQRVAVEGGEFALEQTTRVIRLPALVPRWAETALETPVWSCVTSTWNAFSRANLHIPNLLLGSGAGYGAWRIFGGDSDDHTSQQPNGAP